MDRHQFTPEDRSEQLITETRAQFSALNRAIQAGDPVVTKRITDALGEFIADDNAAANLVRDGLRDQGAFQKVLNDVIWAEAGELAEAEVTRTERNRAESADDDRIERATWAQLVH